MKLYYNYEYIHFMQRSAQWCTKEMLYASGASVCPLNAKVCVLN